MVKATCAPASRKRRKRILKQARGFRGSRSKLIRTAYDAVDRAHAMAYKGRKQKKQQYRKLWTIRINAACRQRGISYSKFIYALSSLKIQCNRKMLSEIAIQDASAFDIFIDKAKSFLASV